VEQPNKRRYISCFKFSTQNTYKGHLSRHVLIWWSTWSDQTDFHKKTKRPENVCSFIKSLPAGSVSRQLFTRKSILYLNNRITVTLGFVCEICQILSKYNFKNSFNNLMLPVPCAPRREWKTIVNRTLNQSETALWNHTLAIDINFLFFRILHPSITLSTVYRVCNRSSEIYIMLIVGRLWTHPVALENQLCGHWPLQSCSSRGTCTCIM